MKLQTVETLVMRDKRVSHSNSDMRQTLIVMVKMLMLSKTTLMIKTVVEPLEVLLLQM